MQLRPQALQTPPLYTYSKCGFVTDDLPCVYVVALAVVEAYIPVPIKSTISFASSIAFHKPAQQVYDVYMHMNSHTYAHSRVHAQLRRLVLGSLPSITTERLIPRTIYLSLPFSLSLSHTHTHTDVHKRRDRETDRQTD